MGREILTFGDIEIEKKKKLAAIKVINNNLIII